MSKNRTTIAALVTCHNRRALTVKCVAALSVAADHARINLRLFLVDDGSTDGTAEAVLAVQPDAAIIRGSGNLYWNGGMRLAWRTALDARHDFYLWLNDDLELLPRALEHLLKLWDAEHVGYQERLIVVGKTLSPTDGKVTYGGYFRVKGWSKLRFRRLSGAEEECVTMNGNCVLIPGCAVKEIGINAIGYTHGYGDIDYGSRVTRAGYRIRECPDPVGFQEKNEKYENSISQLDLSNWRFILFNPKGIALKEWFTFCRAHGGSRYGF